VKAITVEQVEKLHRLAPLMSDATLVICKSFPVHHCVDYYRGAAPGAQDPKAGGHGCPLKSMAAKGIGEIIWTLQGVGLQLLS
jgi:hypothetical protein